VLAVIEFLARPVTEAPTEADVGGVPS
jgi:hypothetical protein